MTSTTYDSMRVLSRALDQAGDVLAQVKSGQLSAATPCAAWDVATLIGHLLADARNFRLMLDGESVDFGAPPEPVSEGWTAAFRSSADDLLHAWHGKYGEEDARDPDLATAEFAVHAWDLATAIGFPTSDLDPEVAERGLAFMRANLTPERRGSAFDAEQEPAGSGSYQLLAAFAGRSAS